MSVCPVPGSVHCPWYPTCTAGPDDASTFPHGSYTTDPDRPVPAAANVPDRSSCPSTSATSRPPAVLFTPVIRPAGSREYDADPSEATWPVAPSYVSETADPLC